MIAVVPPSRRELLEKIFSAGALVVAAPLLPAQQASNSTGTNGIWQRSVYLGIEPGGAVKIVAHRSEMGTGCRTGLPMIVADELEADWNRVQIIQAPGDVKYGSQNTDGSCSVRDFYDALRTAGASAQHARTRRGRQVGRSGRGVPRPKPLRSPRENGAQAVVWRTRSARFGIHRAHAKRGPAQAARAVAVYRQGHSDRRPRSDHGR